MHEQLLISMSRDELSQLINNAVSKALKQVVQNDAQGSLSITDVSTLLKNNGFKRFGYAFIKSRIYDGTFELNDFGRITAESVNKFIKVLSQETKIAS